jgi:hypothetical protein
MEQMWKEMNEQNEEGREGREGMIQAAQSTVESPAIDGPIVIANHAHSHATQGGAFTFATAFSSSSSSAAAAAAASVPNPLLSLVSSGSNGFSFPRAPFNPHMGVREWLRLKWAHFQGEFEASRSAAIRELQRIERKERKQRESQMRNMGSNLSAMFASSFSSSSSSASDLAASSSLTLFQLKSLSTRLARKSKSLVLAKLSSVPPSEFPGTSHCCAQCNQNFQLNEEHQLFLRDMQQPLARVVFRTVANRVWQKEMREMEEQEEDKRNKEGSLASSPAASSSSSPPSSSPSSRSPLFIPPHLSSLWSDVLCSLFPSMSESKLRRLVRDKFWFLSTALTLCEVCWEELNGVERVEQMMKETSSSMHASAVAAAVGTNSRQGGGARTLNAPPSGSLRSLADVVTAVSPSSRHSSSSAAGKSTGASCRGLAPRYGASEFGLDVRIFSALEESLRDWLGLSAHTALFVSDLSVPQKRKLQKQQMKELRDTQQYSALHAAAFASGAGAHPLTQHNKAGAQHSGSSGEQQQDAEVQVESLARKMKQAVVVTDEKEQEVHRHTKKTVQLNVPAGEEEEVEIYSEDEEEEEEEEVTDSSSRTPSSSSSRRGMHRPLVPLDHLHPYSDSPYDSNTAALFPLLGTAPLYAAVQIPRRNNPQVNDKEKKHKKENKNKQVVAFGSEQEQGNNSSAPTSDAPASDVVPSTLSSASSSTSTPSLPSPSISLAAFHLAQSKLLLSRGGSSSSLLHSSDSAAASDENRCEWTFLKNNKERQKELEQRNQSRLERAKRQQAAREQQDHIESRRRIGSPERRKQNAERFKKQYEEKLREQVREKYAALAALAYEESQQQQQQGEGTIDEESEVGKGNSAPPSSSLLHLPSPSVVSSSLPSDALSPSALKAYEASYEKVRKLIEQSSKKREEERGKKGGEQQEQGENNEEKIKKEQRRAKEKLRIQQELIMVQQQLNEDESKHSDPYLSSSSSSPSLTRPLSVPSLLHSSASRSRRVYGTAVIPLFTSFGSQPQPQRSSATPATVTSSAAAAGSSDSPQRAKSRSRSNSPKRSASKNKQKTNKEKKGTAAAAAAAAPQIMRKSNSLPALQTTSERQSQFASSSSSSAAASSSSAACASTSCCVENCNSSAVRC